MLEVGVLDIRAVSATVSSDSPHRASVAETWYTCLRVKCFKLPTDNCMPWGGNYILWLQESTYGKTACLRCMDPQTFLKERKFSSTTTVGLWSWNNVCVNQCPLQCRHAVRKCSWPLHCEVCFALNMEDVICANGTSWFASLVRCCKEGMWVCWTMCQVVVAGVFFWISLEIYCV